MRTSYVVVAAMTVLLLSPSLATAEDKSLADQKTEAEIRKLDAEARNILTTAQMSALNQLRVINGNTATASGAENTAQGLVLMHSAYAGVAQRLASAIAPSVGGKTVIVVFGSAPPSVADFQGFEEAHKRLDTNLDTARRSWAAATKNKGDKSVFGVLLAVSTVASIADLFTVDTTIAGAAATAPEAQFDIQLSQALRTANMDVDSTAYGLASPTTYVDHIMQGLARKYEDARDDYIRGYLPALAKVGGKVGELPSNIAAAGKNLETVMADYEALRKSLYSATGGLSAATIIERQHDLWSNRSSRAILYVRSHKGAVTTETKKDFFTGWNTTPVSMTGAATVDYRLVADRTSEGSVRCATAKINYEAVLIAAGAESAKSVCLTAQAPA